MATFKTATKVKSIGHGSQGIIDLYRYQNENVAVKTYFGGEDIDYSIIKELNIFYKLKSCSSIIHIIDMEIKLYQDRISLKIMMPYYGSDLRNYIEKTDFNTRLKRFNMVMGAMLNALYNLYLIGVIHNDIKPENILVGDNIVLADFGLAIQLPCEVEYRVIHKRPMGSLLFMAPEALTDNELYTHQVDIWSLGITMMEYLTGQPVTEPPQDLLQKYEDTPQIAIYEYILDTFNSPIKEILYIYNITVPDSISNLLQSMLQINPDNRLLISNMTSSRCEVSINDLRRGLPLGNVPIYDLYEVIYKMIHVCAELQLSNVTCFLSINLLERYLANFQVPVKYLDRYAAVCLLLTAKLYESININIYQLKDFYSFTIQELLFTELLVLKNLNYQFSFCETDEMIFLLDDYQPIYKKLMDFYKNLQREGLYSGEMFVFELKEKWEGYY